MKTTMTLTLVLGMAVSGAAMSQESTVKQPVAKPPAPATKAPAKVGSQTHKPTSGKTKAAQVPNQVSAGNSYAATQKRDGRTADGPASSEDPTTDAAKKTTVKKKKSSDPSAEAKAKPQS